MRLFLSVLMAVSLLFSTGCGSPQTTTPTEPDLKVEFYSTQQGLPSEQITCLALFGGQIWAGTKKGIAKFDGVNWQIFAKKNVNALGSDFIEGLAVGDNALFVATENGVAKYDGKLWNSVFTGARARAVAVRGTEIAVATAHGIEYSTGGAFSTYGKDNAGLVYDEVNTVGYDDKGKLWAATRLGMASLNGVAFANFSGPAKTIMGSSLVEVPPSPPNCQLIGNNINCLYAMKNQMAIGTTSGLSITDMGNQWRSYTTTHKDWFQRGGNIVEENVSGNSPIPGNSINALAGYGQDSVLLVGTNKGLAALKDTTWVDIQVKLPSLRAGPITALAVQGDSLWIGTQGGLFKATGLGKIFPSDKK